MTNGGAFYGTFIESWPEHVAALSMPHSGMILPSHDARNLEAAGEGLAPYPFSDGLRDALESALPAFPAGVFLRLGGRSFVTPARGPVRVTDAHEALAVLAAPGPRAALMARRCRLAGRPLWLFLRRWRSIDPRDEIRLFFRDRRLVAATQHHHALPLPDAPARAAAIAAALPDFAARIAAVLHLRDVVVDIWLPERAPPSVVELNPFMAATGAGLFAGLEALAPELRLRDAEGRVLRVPLACGP